MELCLGNTSLVESEDLIFSTKSPQDNEDLIFSIFNESVINNTSHFHN
jgi:hypothetical protein